MEDGFEEVDEKLEDAIYALDYARRDLHKSCFQYDVMLMRQSDFNEVLAMKCDNINRRLRSLEEGSDQNSRPST